MKKLFILNKNVNIYRSKLSKNLNLPKVPKNFRSAYQTFIVKTKQRNELIKYLKRLRQKFITLYLFTN